jgi:hypothetical protein
MRAVLATHPDRGGRDALGEALRALRRLAPRRAGDAAGGEDPRGDGRALQRERRRRAACALPALRHRMILNFEGEAEGVRADAVLEEILASLKPGGVSGWAGDWLRAPRRRDAARRTSSSTRTSSAGWSTSRWPRGASSRAHPGRAAHPHRGQRHRVRGPPRLHARRRPARPRLARLRPHRAPPREALRGGGRPHHLHRPRRLGVDGLRRSGASTTRGGSPRRWPTWRSPTSTAWPWWRVDEGREAHAPGAGQGADLQGLRVPARRCAPTARRRSPRRRGPFAAENKRRGVAIVVSDLYDPAGFERGLNACATRSSSPW